MRKILVHDNGARPFLVVIKGSSVKVYVQYNDHEPLKLDDPYWRYDKEPIFELDNVHRVWTDKSDKEFPENTVLLECKSRVCYLIAWRILRFQLPGEVTNYSSVMGNSLIPYPEVWSNGNFYELWDTKRAQKRGKMKNGFIMTRPEDDPSKGSYDLSFDVVARHPKDKRP